MLGDQAAEVVALQGQPDDAVHRVAQRRQGIGRGKRLLRLAAIAGIVLPEGIHTQLQLQTVAFLVLGTIYHINRC